MAGKHLGGERFRPLLLLVIGVACGTAVGVASNSIAVWVGVGAAIGAALSASYSSRRCMIRSRKSEQS